jgi:hypothetical protein
MVDREMMAVKASSFQTEGMACRNRDREGGGARGDCTGSGITSIRALVNYSLKNIYLHP